MINKALSDLSHKNGIKRKKKTRKKTTTSNIFANVTSGSTTMLLKEYSTSLAKIRFVASATKA